MQWSHNAQWMISGDQGGIIKYWQPNFNNVKVINGHKSAIYGLSASDDQKLKIWDFIGGQEETVLSGHAWEVRTVDWHPHLGMVASGGKDNVLKLWDPRSGKLLVALRRHNNSITELQWNRNGNWLLSGGVDHSVKLFDIRKFKEEIHSYATRREVHSFWMTDDLLQKASVDGAHASQIWSLAWHPMGNVLASGSNDHTTKFWCRPRPGEHLPTELGGKEVDERIFGELPNMKAAERLASSARAADSRTDAPASETTRPPAFGEDATVPKLPGLPGLNSSNNSLLSAQLGDMNGQSQRPLAGLPGIPRASGLPGLSGGSQQPRPSLPPPPPPLSQLHQGQGDSGGPMRTMDGRSRPTSRFSPLQRNQSSSARPRPPAPPPPSNLHR
ncbi:WD repeat-containing protein 33 [Coemansia sp. RSA 2673]|nr:WD repeat-containing protein 33 [Coemansia sp. RSA 2673]